MIKKIVNLIPISYNVTTRTNTDKQSSPSQANTPINNVNTPNPVGVVKGVQQKSPDSNSPVLKGVPPYR